MKHGFVKCIGPMLFLFAAAPASPRVAVVFRLASPPLPVETGQEFTMCAANVGTVNADVVLNFVNVRTSAVVAAKQMMLPPPGGATSTLDPCLAVTADTITKTGLPIAGVPPMAIAGAPPMVVALMIVRHGLFSRAAAATASVQVTAPAANGERRLVASIPLYQATMINGRNTPIETIH